MNTAALNDFNLLPRGTDSFQSQDSLVISTAGAVTDSHSDDHSGSNHCFVGAKLWLMWDTSEGFQHGLEDVERCDVDDKAAFDLQAFLSMRSSRWLFITSGHTMFIPANLTHKVITLERYIGLGSFHAALPSFLRSLVHWSQLTPLWANKSGRDSPYSVEFITRRAIRKMCALRHETSVERIKWGLPFVMASIRDQADDDVPGSIMMMHEDPNIRSFIRAAQKI
jgi:hypothetical protein